MSEFNLVADTLVAFPSYTSHGCVSTVPEIQPMPTSMSKEQCATAALNNQQPFFGWNGATSQCFLSPQWTDDTALQDASRTIKVIWSSGTSSGSPAQCGVSNEGIASVVDTNDGTVLWASSPTPVAGCMFGGGINSATTTGSFGSNCVGKPLNIDCGTPDPVQSYSADGIIGNLSGILVGALPPSGASSAIVNPLSDWPAGTDPAFCCIKTVDYAYQCGDRPFKSGTVSGGVSITFDCSAEQAECAFQLVLKDNGELSLQNIFTNTSVWIASADYTNLVPNDAWVATNGKNARNYLSAGEYLAAGEWIGSTDGRVRLIMQPSGNAELQTSRVRTECSDSSLMEAYRHAQLGSIALLNKLALTRDEGKTAQLYAEDLQTPGNTFTTLAYVDAPGNDLAQVSAPTLSECQSQCLAQPDQTCGGFTWQSDTQTCFLKDREFSFNVSRTLAPSSTVGVRQPVVANATKCISTTRQTDTDKLAQQITDKPTLTECPAGVAPLSVDEQTSWMRLDRVLATRSAAELDRASKNLSTSRQNIADMSKRTNWFRDIWTRQEPFSATTASRQYEDSALVVKKDYYTFMLWTVVAACMVVVAVRSRP